MISRIKQLYKNEYLMNRLMHLYSFLLVGTILLAVAALCFFSGYTNRKNVANQINLVENQLDSIISNKIETLSVMYMELAGSYAAIENVRHYIELPPDAYFEYTNKFWEEYQIDNRVSSILYGFFSAHPDLEEFYITLDETDTYIKADRQNPNGIKMTGPFSQPTGLTMKRYIVDPYNFQPVGVIYSVFSREAALGRVSDFVEEAGISVFVIDETGNLVFLESNWLDDSDKQIVLANLQEVQTIPKEVYKKYIIQKNHKSRDISSVILANKGLLFKKTFLECAMIFSVGAFIAVILLIGLHRTFQRYLKQVAAIVQITHAVGDGNLKAKIDTSKVQEELYELATSINFMIASLDQFIRENYELEINQRDAHMRALQSQINPHFLYNTLEYIRMYALSQQQEELADVVFSFSALLRNNTNQEKTTTLAKELSFCEKYVYLYQMRYPDQIAYHFQMEDSLKQLQIPKFTIQPLIENYFVHGIDYKRNDNAISVKAFRDEELGLIIIEVRDNGKGISEKRLTELRHRLTDTEENLVQSIGLKNVHERLKSFFDRYQLEIQSVLNEGTTIMLKINDDRGRYDV